MFDTVRAKLKGFKTLIASQALTTAGVLAALGAYDLTPLVQLFVKNETYLAIAMIGLGLFFGLMRVVSNTPVGSSDTTPAGQVAPVERGVDQGV